MSLSPLELIYCYASKDLELLQQMEKHLEPLCKSGFIETWDHSKISYGKPQEPEITKHLKSARIILLLVSSYFLASASCCKEVDQVMERLSREEAIRVIPILLRPVDWTNAPFSVLRPLPSKPLDNPLPVTLWSNRDDAFKNIADGIGKVVNELRMEDSGCLESPKTPSKEPQGPIEKPPLVIRSEPPPIKQESPTNTLTQTNSQQSSAPVQEPVTSVPVPAGVSSSMGSQIAVNNPDPTSLNLNPSNPVSTLIGKDQSNPISTWRNKKQAKLTRVFPFMRGRKALVSVISSVLILAVLAALIVYRDGFSITLQQSPIHTWTTPLGENVGISDGRFVFDTYHPTDGADKNQAAQAFASKNFTLANQLWNKAIQKDPGDAEALIYQEDERVVTSDKPYITLVVGTILTGPNRGVGRDDLQGAYVAQKEFNSDSSNTFQVRLLIANSGSGDEAVAGQVAQQIVQAASQDHTIVGIMGWPYSESSLHAVQALKSANAHIPIVSESATTDDLDGISPYFFRVVPSDAHQGDALANYVAKKLRAKRIAVFADPNNAYSNDLANQFRTTCKRLGCANSIVVTEYYTVGPQGQAQLSTLLNDALSHNPDAIFFSGYASDASVLLDALPSTAQMPIIGGEALYEIGSYNNTNRARLSQLRLLSDAYPDEWGIAGLAEPPFFGEYSNDFNPSGKAKPGDYGVTRADNDVIVSYDATKALLTASKAALGSRKMQKGEITPDQTQQALRQIDDQNPMQGASGRIAFESDGNPINKPVVLLSVNQEVQFQEKDPPIDGCLKVDSCTN